MVRLSEEDRNFISAEIRAGIAEQLANFKIESVTIVGDEITKAVAPLIAQINELSELVKSKDAVIKTLEESNQELKDNQLALEETIVAQNKRNIQLRAIMQQNDDVNESYSRKDSVRLGGIPIAAEEDNALLTQTVIETLNQYDVEVNKEDIFRLHRSGKKQKMNEFRRYAKLPEVPNDNAETSEVLIRFTRWQPRMEVYNIKYKRDVPLRTRCDLTKYRQDVMKLAREHLRENQLGGYVYVNAECKLVLCDAETKRRFIFTTMAEFTTMANLNIREDPNFNHRR